MKSLNHGGILTGLAALLILLQPVLTFGQPIWTALQPPSAVTLEVLKPSFSEADNLTFLTSVSYLSGRYAYSGNSAVEVELPIAYYGVSSDYSYLESKLGIGNPYVGLHVNPRTGFVGRFGVRIPVASDENPSMSVGVIGDFDRFEAFVPKTATGVMSLGTRFRPSETFLFEWGVGPVVAVPTTDAGGDVELFAQYRLQAMYEGRSVSAGVGFSGRGIITEPDLNFGERTVNQLTLIGLAHFPGVHPGLYVRFPVDDWNELLNFTLGLNVTFEI